MKTEEEIKNSKQLSLVAAGCLKIDQKIMVPLLEEWFSFAMFKTIVLGFIDHSVLHMTMVIFF